MSQQDIFNLQVNGEGMQVSMEDLLGIDMGQIEPTYGRKGLPDGVYEGRINGWEVKAVTWTGRDGEITSPVFECQVTTIGCRTCKDPNVDTTTLIGVDHYEGFFIVDVKEDLGKISAFLLACGMSGQGLLKQLCDESIGLEIVFATKQTRSKKDKDKIRTNIAVDSVQPLNAAATQGESSHSAPSQLQPTAAPVTASPSPLLRQPAAPTAAKLPSGFRLTK